MQGHKWFILWHYILFISEFAVIATDFRYTADMPILQHGTDGISKNWERNKHVNLDKILELW